MAVDIDGSFHSRNPIVLAPHRYRETVFTEDITIPNMAEHLSNPQEELNIAKHTVMALYQL